MKNAGQVADDARWTDEELTNNVAGLRVGIANARDAGDDDYADELEERLEALVAETGRRARRKMN